MMKTLDQLPAEVLLQTFSHLHYRDLVSVGRTCKQLHWLSKDDFLLQRIANRDFGDHYSSYSDEDISIAVFLVKSGHLPPDIVLDRRNKLSQAWFRLDHQPALAELACAAVLATHGFLNYNFQLNRMNLRGDISSVPAEDLGNLARCIGDTVHIEAVCGDLGPVLSNIKCRKLILGQVALSESDTGSLVAAMVRGVKEVWLRAGVSLDMETLAQYDGKGKCESVPLWDDTRERYGARVDSWAGEMGWDVSGDSGNFTNIERVHSRRRGLFGGGCKV